MPALSVFGAASHQTPIKFTEGDGTGRAHPSAIGTESARSCRTYLKLGPCRSRGNQAPRQFDEQDQLVIGLISDESLFLTLPTWALTGQHVISPAG
jgi:hypothetical protein